MPGLPMPGVGAEVRGRWVPVGERLPAEETPVVILLNGALRIGELRWDVPGYEDTYRAYLYWDDPSEDGQCWESESVTHWLEILEA